MMIPTFHEWLEKNVDEGVGRFLGNAAGSVANIPQRATRFAGRVAKGALGAAGKQFNDFDQAYDAQRARMNRPKPPPLPPERDRWMNQLGSKMEPTQQAPAQPSVRRPTSPPLTGDDEGFLEPGAPESGSALYQGDEDEGLYLTAPAGTPEPEYARTQQGPTPPRQHISMAPRRTEIPQRRVAMRRMMRQKMRRV